MGRRAGWRPLCWAGVGPGVRGGNDAVQAAEAVFVLQVPRDVARLPSALYRRVAGSSPPPSPSRGTTTLTTGLCMQQHTPCSMCGIHWVSLSMLNPRKCRHGAWWCCVCPPPPPASCLLEGGCGPSEHARGRNTGALPPASAHPPLLGAWRSGPFARPAPCWLLLARGAAPDGRGEPPALPLRLQPPGRGPAGRARALACLEFE